MKLKVFYLTFVTLVLANCSRTPVTPPAPTLDAIQQGGQAVFNLRCAQCHATVPNTILIGPSLAGIATRADGRSNGHDAETYIEESILAPGTYVVEGFPNSMPTNFSRELTVEELEALVAYLMTLE